MSETLPILYSFRRCPYAMRARLSLHYAGVKLEHREIILRDKPQAMLDASPKGTIPVLILPNGTVIDESLDIMKWAAQENDPKDWFARTDFTLIAHNDTAFKPQLDRYKYPTRYQGEDCSGAQENCRAYFEMLNTKIAKSLQLGGLTDYAIFPFIRQCASVDKDWFAALPYAPLQNWLRAHLDSAIFKDIMQKHDLWRPDAI
jgi:glutathione S-transferase